MNYFRVHSLYFIKGINYQGPSFSLVNEGSPKVSIFSDLSKCDMEPYATNVIIGNNWLACIGGGKKYDYSDATKIGQQLLLLKSDEYAGKGVFVEIVNQCPTDIELLHCSEVSKKLDPANLKPIPLVNPAPEPKYVIYRDGEDISIGSIQYEFDEEIERIERQNANSMLMLALQDEVYGVKKINIALSIVVGEKIIWLNQPKVSITSESAIGINKQEIMLDKLHKKVDVLKFMDGLLLMQAIGYNTDTPYAQFMSAWVLLEKFLEKYFASFNSNFVVDKAKSNLQFLNKRTQKYVNCLINHEEEFEIYKFNVADKFVICCAASEIKLSKATIDSFLSIKKRRDGLHHSIGEKEFYPAGEIFHLLRLFFL